MNCLTCHQTGAALVCPACLETLNEDQFLDALEALMRRPMSADEWETNRAVYSELVIHVSEKSAGEKFREAMRGKTE